MHVLAAVFMGLGAIVLLVLGLSSVLRDLLERSPHEPPLLEDDGLSWPRRYQGITETSSARFQAPRQWAGGHDSGRK